MLADIEQFIAWIRMLSPQAKTWRDYRCDLDLFTLVAGDRTTTEILPQDVDRFVSHQIEQGFKPSTINRRLAAVVSFYRYQISKGRASSCPVLPKRHYLRVPQRLPRPVNEQDLRKFFRSITDVRDRAMFTLMLHCGLRIGEVSSLEMTDLYLQGSCSHLIVRGKGSQERMVYLSHAAETVLQGWLAQRPSSLRDRHVFLSYQHKKLSTTSISKRVKWVCQASGVDLTAHRLRHSFADHLLSAGMPITSIQKLMGHRFLETTQNYATANDKQVQADFYKACERLEGWTLLDDFQMNDLQLGLTDGVKVEQTDNPEASLPAIRMPARFSPLPGALRQQLEAYLQLKVSRWRVERVAANSTGFYCLHGRMWEFFCGECSLKNVSELQLEHVQQFIKARLDSGRSARTVNGSLSCLRSFLAFLQEDQIPIHASLENIQRLKEPGRLPRSITTEQVLRLKNEMDGNLQKAVTSEKQYDSRLLRAAFYLLWQGGLRSGEVELLRFSDLLIAKANGAKRVFIRDGKWRKGRAVYLTDTALAALNDYLEVRVKVPVDGFVFVKNGLPLQKNFLSQQIKAIGRQADVIVSPHRLRHTYATQLLNVGCRVTSIQKLLGHTSLNTTMIYARTFDQTVMQDYFQALDTLEAQPDGPWFGLNEMPSID